MKKMENGKVSIWTRLKEAWKVPRYHALMTLGLYALFFSSIYLYITITSQFNKEDEKLNETVDPFQSFEAMQSYEYTYDITSSINGIPTTYQVLGTHVDTTDTFTLNSYKFYIQNGTIYAKDEVTQITDLLPVNLMMLLPENLARLFKDMNLVSKTAYENGNMKVIFNIPILEFNIASLSNIGTSETSFITSTVYIENNELVKIHFDLYEIMKFVLPNIDNYTIDITYDNINAIKSVEEF